MSLSPILCVIITIIVPSPLSVCYDYKQVEQLSTWRAHVSEVVSIEHIPYDGGGLVLTASADCTARLWTITGNYIGTFGQVRGWGYQYTHHW